MNNHIDKKISDIIDSAMTEYAVSVVYTKPKNPSDYRPRLKGEIINSAIEELNNLFNKNNEVFNHKIKPIN